MKCQTSGNKNYLLSNGMRERNYKVSQFCSYLISVTLMSICATLLLRVRVFP